MGQMHSGTQSDLELVLSSLWNLPYEPVEDAEKLHALYVGQHAERPVTKPRIHTKDVDVALYQ